MQLVTCAPYHLLTVNKTIWSGDVEGISEIG
jgi:hypothetical protein